MHNLKVLIEAYIYIYFNRLGQITIIPLNYDEIYRVFYDMIARV